MSLTKADIVESIRKRCGFPKNRSHELLEMVLDLIRQSLIAGEDVLISGFGKFCVKDRTARKGNHPITGNAVTLGARRVVTFRSSPVLRKRLIGKE